MTKKRNMLFMLMVLVLVPTFLNIVTAQPPPFQEINSVSSQSYIIEFPKLENAYIDNGFQFNSHVVFNNGTHFLDFNKSEVPCYLEGYNVTGHETFSSILNVTEDGDEYTINIPGEVFYKPGGGYYTMYCIDDNGVMGLASAPFTTIYYDDGEFKMNLNDTFTLIMLFIMFIVILILLITKNKLWGGGLTVIMSIVLMQSGANWLFSGFIFCIGFILILSEK